MSVNKIILIGNVGKEPEVRYYDNGGAVANFSLATTERGYTAANGTQVPDRTEWHNIVLWRGLAEIAEKYVHKGSKIYIEGKIRTRSYDDQQGIKRYVTEVWGDNMELLDRKPDGAQSNRPPFPEPPVATTVTAPAQTATATATPAAQTQTQTQATPSLESDGGDDLPF
ncbi:MAG: single-stranded DNA-binding protein [Candidatus Symbiothrix sp.]|jgi:single-strand DNA-binding protein|nr:single-stranded DNA-binding protein [Candidatus Symbiothrix sp.]